MEQITIYDILYPERIDPVKEVAKMADPYWTASRQKLIDLCNTDPDIEDFAAAVKHEYSPYGFAGHYGGDDKPNTIRGYNLLSGNIRILYFDNAGELMKAACSWKDFARKIADMIRAGEYT